MHKLLSNEQQALYSIQYNLVNIIAVFIQCAINVTEFCKITLMGAPETIGIFEFTFLLPLQKHILNISILFKASSMY